MPALPSESDFINAGTVTVDQFRQRFGTLRAYLVDLFGDTGELPATLAKLGTLFSSQLTMTAAGSISAAQRGAFVSASGAFTVSLLAAATAGAGFTVAIRNSGTGLITIDPDAAETIDGAATLVLAPGRMVMLTCTGTTWLSFGLIDPALGATLDTAALSRVMPNFAGDLNTLTGAGLPAAKRTYRLATGFSNGPTGAAAGDYVEVIPAAAYKNVIVGSGDPGNASFWPASVTQAGITATRIASGTRADGLAFVRYRYQGTATGTGVGNTYAFANGRSPAVAGQTWTCSANISLVGGTDAGVAGIVVGVVEENNTNNTVGTTSSTAAKPTTDTTISATRALIGASTVQVRPQLTLNMTSGAVIDVTFEIAGFQLEIGPARTSFEGLRTPDDVFPGSPIRRSVQRLIGATATRRDAVRRWDGATWSAWASNEFARPQTAAGIGQWAGISGTAYTLPAGGTWAWHYSVFTSAGALVTAGQTGVSAGGTQIFAGTGGQVASGMAWRIE